MNRFDLVGRSSVIVGGGKGIGLAVAQRLAASGASICLWDRDGKALDDAVATLPANSHFVQLDVASERAVNDAAVETLRWSNGELDILVNSAGVVGPHVPTWEFSLSDWQRHLDINLTATFLCIKALLPAMQKNSYGRIVNVSSMAGKEGNVGSCAYSAAKAGVIALTKVLGKELAKEGVIVNCVAPTVTQTSLLQQSSAEHLLALKEKIPMGRFGEPSELAAMIAWLCTAECSFTTGATFDFSGGRATY
ncbi:SDR family NAD(P)-dependent oxidoreductase [Polaromonas sp.]|uniref:SDR family NAD(P)-dependent oxidoreductase n=1 Tax=Polaromonas sp. TaxID=1869339 RepID=UPI00352A8181